MKALFGEGIHPNADMITRAETDAGHGSPAALAATRLGKPFNVKTGASEFRIEVAQAVRCIQQVCWGEVECADPCGCAGAGSVGGFDRHVHAKEFGRAPLDERELSGWTAQKSRQRTTDVAAFDLTFTPPKSVECVVGVGAARRRAGHRGLPRRGRAGHDRVVGENAFFSRIGAGGVGQVDVDGVVAAAFKHRDSRAGDPNLHTHVPVSNVVPVSMPDGSRRWLRLDSQTPAQDDGRCERVLQHAGISCG